MTSCPLPPNFTYSFIRSYSGWQRIVSYRCCSTTYSQASLLLFAARLQGEAPRFFSIPFIISLFTIVDRWKLALQWCNRYQFCDCSIHEFALSSFLKFLNRLDFKVEANTLQTSSDFAYHGMFFMLGPIDILLLFSSKWESRRTVSGGKLVSEI